MEWVGGAGLFVFMLLWLFLAIVDREPKLSADATLVADRAKRRLESHNEWLKAWYNALPLVERSGVLNGFENWSEDRERRGQWVSARHKTDWVLSSMTRMVDAVLNPPVANFATDTAVTGMVVGHVRTDSIRSASMLDDPAAVDRQALLDEANRYKEVRLAWAKAHHWPS